MLFTGMASYYANQVGIASAMGDRPTREEVNGHVQELKEIIVREVAEIKDQQKTANQAYQTKQAEVRQDIKDLHEVIIQILQRR